MESLSASKKLFQVVVVVGMGASLGASGCSSSSGPATGTDAEATDTGGGMKHDGATHDAVTHPDAPVADTSTPTDACAGWAPCC
jgi:hypothetical protein